MPRHVVQRGDTILRIAHRYGHVDADVVYQHPDNAALREARPDPSLLVAGDVVFVPELEEKIESVAIDAAHRFRVRRPKAICRIAIEDESGESLAGERFELRIDDETIEGTIPGDGVLELEVSPDPRIGHLTVWQTTPERLLTFTLGLGHLEPIETLAGVKGRLRNLGFDPGEIHEEKLDVRARGALRAFQIVAALPITGEADDATRAALVDAHDVGT